VRPKPVVIYEKIRGLFDRHSRGRDQLFLFRNKATGTAGERGNNGMAKATLFTNDGAIFYVGAVTINGTNVPMSNVTLTASGPVAPDTNATAK
jgi:hypothetical protein